MYVVEVVGGFLIKLQRPTPLSDDYIFFSVCTVRTTSNSRARPGYRRISVTGIRQVRWSFRFCSYTQRQILSSSDSIYAQCTQRRHKTTSDLWRYILCPNSFLPPIFVIFLSCRTHPYRDRMHAPPAPPQCESADCILQRGRFCSAHRF